MNKMRIKFSDLKPSVSQLSVQDTIDVNSKYFHYFIKRLLGNEISNQFKEKIIFNKFLEQEVSINKNYWATVEECNDSINDIIKRIEYEDEYQEKEFKPKPNLNAPTGKFKRNQSKMILTPKGNNSQKKQNSPINIKPKDKEKQIELQLMNPVEIAGEENKLIFSKGSGKRTEVEIKNKEDNEDNLINLKDNRNKNYIIEIKN
jgi:hypothetical protein